MTMLMNVAQGYSNCAKRRQHFSIVETTSNVSSEFANDLGNGYRYPAGITRLDGVRRKRRQRSRLWSIVAPI